MTIQHTAQNGWPGVRMLPPPQNVESMYVFGAAPEPTRRSAHAAGSSAPLSVETTSMRWTLMPRHRIGRGNVAGLPDVREYRLRRPEGDPP
jgi:hypothetical protein